MMRRLCLSFTIMLALSSAEDTDNPVLENVKWKTFEKNVENVEDTSGLRTLAIWNGLEAREGELPWQVLLLIDATKGTCLCGGTLIKPDLVLSAAHCMYLESCLGKGGSVNSIQVVAGTTDRFGNGGQRILAQSYSTHPHFHLKKRKESDIALVKLTRPFQLNSKIQVVKLSPKKLTSGDCITSGYGRMSREGIPADRLLVGKVKIAADDECYELFPTASRSDGGHICAVSNNSIGVGEQQQHRRWRGMIRPCLFCGDLHGHPFPYCTKKGDSGGPLVCRDRKGRFKQAGVTSMLHRNQPNKTVYSLFVNVAKYRTWVQGCAGQLQRTTFEPIPVPKTPIPMPMLPPMPNYSRLQDLGLGGYGGNRGGLGGFGQYPSDLGLGSYGGNHGGLGGFGKYPSDLGLGGYGGNHGGLGGFGQYPSDLGLGGYGINRGGLGGFGRGPADLGLGGYGRNDGLGGFGQYPSDLGLGGYGRNRGGIGKDPADLGLGGYGRNRNRGGLGGFGKDPADLGLGGYGRNRNRGGLGGFGKDPSDLGLGGYGINRGGLGGFGRGPADLGLGGYGRNDGLGGFGQYPSDLGLGGYGGNRGGLGGFGKDPADLGLESYGRTRGGFGPDPSDVGLGGYGRNDGLGGFGRDPPGIGLGGYGRTRGGLGGLGSKPARVRPGGHGRNYGGLVGFENYPAVIGYGEIPGPVDSSGSNVRGYPTARGSEERNLHGLDSSEMNESKLTSEPVISAVKEAEADDSEVAEEDVESEVAKQDVGSEISEADVESEVAEAAVGTIEFEDRQFSSGTERKAGKSLLKVECNYY